MTTVRKYGFDTVFSPAGEVLRDAKGHRSIYTEEEMVEVRNAAFAEGQNTEIAKAEKAAADAAAALAKQAQLLLTRLDAESKALRQEALTLAMAAARASAGAALDHFGEERALAIAEEAFSHLRGAPRLLARVPEAVHARLAPRLQAAAAERGLAEGLTVRADAKARPGDITLEWSEGRIAVEFTEIEARLQALVGELSHDIEATP